MSRFRAVTILGCAALAATMLPGAPACIPAGAAEPAAVDKHAGNAALHWHPPGEEASLAAEEDKPILYFFTAEWCAPCHKLRQDLFDDPEKAARISERFVPVEVQDTRVERGVNRPEVAEVVERYAVTSFPTLVISLPDGTRVAQQKGYPGASRSWSWLQRHGAEATERLGAD